jgi:TetR/AcrR family transcriptional repressor of nem operon
MDLTKMGRTKVFEENAALGQAMRLFWRQGYANTSIKQLLTEMDMLNGSFYHSFKDKKTIYLKALEHYNQEITYKRQAALKAHDDFSKGIRAFFEEIYKTLESSKEPNGCLIVNSMVDEVLSEEELKDFLYNDAESFVQFLTQRIQHSIDLKHTKTGLPARQLAFILITYIQGLFRISSMLKTKQLKKQTEEFLQALNL